MKILLGLLLFGVISCAAQEFPDAPQVQSSSPDYSKPLPPLPPDTWQEKRHNIDWVVFGGALVIEQAAAYYDSHETVIGLRHGVAIEGNTFLLPNDKPTFGQLEKREWEFYVPVVFGPALVGKLLNCRQWFYIGLASPAAYTVKHIQGGNAWRTLLKQDN
jgi:hypothetical protein